MEYNKYLSEKFLIPQKSFCDLNDAMKVFNSQQATFSVQGNHLRLSTRNIRCPTTTQGVLKDCRDGNLIKRLQERGAEYFIWLKSKAYTNRSIIGWTSKTFQIEKKRLQEGWNMIAYYERKEMEWNNEKNIKVSRQPTCTMIGTPQVRTANVQHNRVLSYFSSRRYGLSQL